MKFRVASALFAVLLLAGCGQEAPEESPEGNATQSPDGSAADADLKVTVNGEELPLDSHICATYDHKTVLTAYFENMLPALAIDLEGDEISNITLWDANDSDRHHSWGVNYYGSDPVAKVTQDRWVFDAVVREYELYDQGNLETLEIHAE